jgi:hypothetical protein
MGWRRKRSTFHSLSRRCLNRDKWQVSASQRSAGLKALEHLSAGIDPTGHAVALASIISYLRTFFISSRHMALALLILLFFWTYIRRTNTLFYTIIYHVHRSSLYVFFIIVGLTQTHCSSHVTTSNENHTFMRHTLTSHNAPIK